MLLGLSVFINGRNFLFISGNRKKDDSPIYVDDYLINYSTGKYKSLKIRDSHAIIVLCIVGQNASMLPSLWFVPFI